MKLLILIYILGIADSATVEFFKENNFKTLLTIGNSASDPRTCFNLPEQSRKLVTSLKTEDSCVLLFDDLECKGHSIKITKNAANLGDLVGNGTNDNFDKTIVSYRFCGDDEGNIDYINVDFFDGKVYKNLTTSYENICNCVSLPAKALVNVTSIHNHHNCIEIFTTDNCQDDKNSLVLFGGKSSKSEDLTRSSVYSKMQSFIPCLIPKKCSSLIAKVYHIEVTDASEEDIAEQSQTTTLSMTAKTTVWNNGSANVYQEYIASRKVREVVDIHSIKWSGNQQWSSLDLIISIDINSMNFSQDFNLASGLTEMYSKVESHYSKDTHPIETSKEFTATQEIHVPACSFYEVQSYIKVVENFPMEYKVFIRFTGEIAEERMTAEELKKAIGSTGDFTYHDKIDDYTVSAYASSILSASFGIGVEIKGNGAKIPNCFM